MALPSSGIITFNDVRYEMSQSQMTNYSFANWKQGTWGDDTPTQYYSPINVHEGNAGKYSTDTYDFSMNDWYGYNHTLYYTESLVSQSLFCNVSPVCNYASSMLPFYLGTNNHTVTIKISGSYGDFGGIISMSIWYGKPWSVDGADLPQLHGATLVQGYAIGYNEFSTEYTYNYVYNPDSGSYIYIVLYGGYCP